MAACDICGDDKDFSYTCRRCEGQFCGYHRHPESHDCDGGLVGDYKQKESGPDSLEVDQPTPTKAVEEIGDSSPDVAVDGSLKSKPSETSPGQQQDTEHRSNPFRTAFYKVRGFVRAPFHLLREYIIPVLAFLTVFVIIPYLLFFA